MIRIGIDLRHLPALDERGAGVTHASLEITEDLIAHAQDYGIVVVPLRGKLRSWQLAARLKREKIDALFCPSGAVPPFLCLPTFPWVHDLAIFDHPEWFPQSRAKRWLTTRLFLRGARRARQVFSVSEDTKRALMRHAKISAGQITVTYEGVDVRKDAPKQGKYFIIVGTIEPRKNIPFIIDLWEDVRASCGDVRLVLLGQTGWGNISIPKREWITRVKNATDEERDAWIAGALALLLPSFHEGFGRPALEAMTLGVPVIASDQGALPEVVGDAGILLDQTDREGWIQACVQAARGSISIEKAREQASLFDREKTARLILAKMAKHC